jgi:putative glycosyltransferase (TIGR04372 family)
MNFIYNQIEQVRKGGISILFGKLCAIPLILLALPVVFLVRILRPLVVIRFESLHSNRIGHFALDAELYLCERDAGMHNSRSVDIFYYNGQISNYQLKRMWDRKLHICYFAKWVDRINRLLPGAQNHVVPMSSSRDIYGLFKDLAPHLSFTAAEERLGQEGLRTLGIPDGNPFVCFNARDSAYLETELSSKDWSYHNYRDSNIHNYLPAAEELVRQGYFAIRMGVFVKERLNIANYKIIDYAVNYRTDFLDIYLGAKCRFFICDTAGIYAIPMIFRRPIVWVNYIPLEHAPTWGTNHLFIPKKLWLRKERRFLTFREILYSGIGRFLKNEQYEQMRIEVIENTPEEITALVIEMDERLKGRWQDTEEDEELQRCFWSIFKPSELNQVFLARIGTEFLRQNQELLDLDTERRQSCKNIREINLA